MLWPLLADREAPRRVMTLHTETMVPASLSDTFKLFADASNLQRLTPPWLDLSVVTGMPVVMRVGTEIDYRIRLYGVPIPWKSRIDVWEPGVRFVDRQLIGPYRWWHHEHRFEERADGTLVIDHVQYAPRVGWLSGGFVRRDLQRIFAYRQEALRQLLTQTITPPRPRN